MLPGIKTVPLEVVLQGTPSLYPNDAKFKALNAPDNPATVKFRSTRSPLPCISVTPNRDMASVPGVGVLTDKVRPPPFELPTAPNVTPKLGPTGVITAGSYVILMSTDMA